MDWVGIRKHYGNNVKVQIPRLWLGMTSCSVAPYFKHPVSFAVVTLILLQFIPTVHPENPTVYGFL